MSKVRSGYEILRKDGLIRFFRSAIEYAYERHIRRYMPKSGNIVQNKVVLPDEKRVLDSYILESSRDDPDREDGVVSAHTRHTREGDSIVIVGGGNGVTAVRAAKIVGEDGEVLVFEGGEGNLKKIREVFNINGVNDYCNVNHAVVGRNIDVWGDATGADEIRPSQLPSCNVLELDCEGSEVEVLEELEIEPRVLIMELHPFKFLDDADYLFELLESKGYEVTSRYGHDGVEITKNEFEMLYRKSIEDGEETPKSERRIKSGARWPVIIAAIRVDETP